MRNAFLLLTLLSVGASIPAQQIIPSGNEGCPIGFSAQLNGRAIARTVEDQKKNGDGPLLELTFGRRDSLKMLSASITVHGLSSSNRYLPVNQRSDEKATQTFELRPVNGAADLTNAEVWLNKILFVSWVELTEMKYADGSAWHASSGVQCRAVPSKFLLVDATATQ
jgi:dipeptidyl aminopeptidase/acylaminoacyl peptidase